MLRKPNFLGPPLTTKNRFLKHLHIDDLQIHTLIHLSTWDFFYIKNLKLEVLINPIENMPSAWATNDSKLKSKY